MNQIRLAWLDDDQLVREAVVRRFKREPDLECVLVESSLEGFIERLKERTEPIDLVLLDVALRGQKETGLDAIATIDEFHPEAAIALLTNYIDKHNAILGRALDLGVTGFIAKKDVTEIADCIRRCVGNDPFVTSTSAGPIIGNLTNKRSKSPDVWDWFTERKRDFLGDLARSEALTRKGICDEIHRSPSGVDSYLAGIRRILEKKANVLDELDEQLITDGKLQLETLRIWARKHHFGFESPER